MEIPKSSIQKLLYVARNSRLAKYFMTFLWEGYLEETGWIPSYRQQKPVNRNNQPLPWVTYAFIDFITERLSNNMVVLEYGSGNSTLFYASYVRKVYAVEHDEAWFKEISGRVPENVSIEYVELTGDGRYTRFAATLSDRPDIIIVDGRERVNCIKEGTDFLAGKGVVVLDDSERPEYQEAIVFLRARQFRKLDFWGIAPGIFYRKCTTIFYKPDNCLGI